MSEDVTLPLKGFPQTPAAPGGYRLLRRLGAGGGGEVWEALDRLGRTVALKMLRRSGDLDLHQARVEVAALRWLRLPGVVLFLDEGETGECYWIAMERVSGSAFPGPKKKLSWAELAPLALRLLTILADVHRAGVIHRDLKPANVSVDDQGRVTLLDFGLASGGALNGRLVEPGAGTSGYVAPECLLGEPPTVASDLYAVGVMLRQALTGNYLFFLPLPPDLPPVAAQMIQRMLDADPAVRPASAREVAESLGNPPRKLKVGSDFRTLFNGPTHYLRFPERGATWLWAATGGDPEKVASELEDWERRGLGHWEGEGFTLDRIALAELGGEEEAALGRRLQAGEERARIRDESIRLANNLLERGFSERAMRLCERALELGGDTECLGVLAAVAATRLESLASMSRAICLIRRCPDTPVLHAVDRLLQAGEQILKGNCEAVPSLLASITIPLPEVLEIWKMGTRLQALRGRPEEEEALRKAESWADSPERRARWEGWLGYFCYRRERYAEAAALHLSSARGRRSPDSRLAAERAAAAALMEGGDPAGARTLAAAVRKGAAHYGQPALEAHAEWVERSAAWRMGQPFEPDPERIAAAAYISPALGGLHAFQDAVVAWHTENWPQAATLAAQGERLLRSVGQPAGAALAGCLRLACEGGTVEEADSLSHLLQTAATSSLVIQGLALLSGRWPGRWATEAEERIGKVPMEERGRRLELMSCAEGYRRCCTL